jgi:hypothetical protein
MSDGGVSLDPPERTMGRRWLAVAGAALVTGASAAQVVVPAAETSPPSIAGIAPSYGPKTVSAAFPKIRRHAMPCHHKVDKYLIDYLDGDGLGDDPKGRCFARWAAAPASSRARC